jgi:hypothetical protein
MNKCKDCNRTITDFGVRCNHCAKLGKRHYLFGKHISENTKEKMRKKMRQHWLNPKFKRKMDYFFVNRITSYEKKIIKIIDKYKLPFKYVGKGEVVICGKCPDFINVNGQKQVIEVFADYWKIRDYGSVRNYIKQRKKDFNKFGFDVLFINDRKLRKPEEGLAKDIINFQRRKIKNVINSFELLST